VPPSFLLVAGGCLFAELPVGRFSPICLRSSRLGDDTGNKKPQTMPGLFVLLCFQVLGLRGGYRFHRSRFPPRSGGLC
jgi:hypothetical protein